MKYLSRGTRVLMLVGIFVVMATSATFAQVSPALGQGQPQAQVVQQAIQNWDKTHPLEYYLALPVSAYVSQAQAVYRDNRHPLEYYLALPVSPQVAQVQVPNRDNRHPLEYYLALPVSPQVANIQVPNQDNRHPLEYYLALPISPQIAQNQADATVDNLVVADNKTCDKC